MTACPVPPPLLTTTRTCIFSLQEDEFGTLLATLNSLAEDGSGEHALAVVRQMSLTRSFDVKQAVQLVKAVGVLSPFDQIEAAVLLYSRVLNPDSFHLVLACFEDLGDRDNIMHRLGVVVQADGSVVAVTAKAAKAAAAAAGVGGGGPR